MRYAILSCVALAACIAAGVLVVHLLGRSRGSAWGRAKRMLLSALCAAMLFAAAGLAYLLPYSHADETAQAALKSTSDVQVSTTANGWLFDGPGTNTALVFYPGAKVDAVAYAPLLRELASQGDDCFLVDMPFHMAIFGSDAAADLMAEYDYDSWILAGHSMGGVAATTFAAAHPADVSALVLLAAYPTADVPDGVALLSIYGTEDGILELDVYEDGRAHWPANATEVVIAGGNHAQFGCYGAQAGDNPAAIAPEAQRAQTEAAILAL